MSALGRASDYVWAIIGMPAIYPATPSRTVRRLAVLTFPVSYPLLFALGAWLAVLALFWELFFAGPVRLLRSQWK